MPLDPIRDRILTKVVTYKLIWKRDCIIILHLLNLVLVFQVDFLGLNWAIIVTLNFNVLNFWFVRSLRPCELKGHCIVHWNRHALLIRHLFDNKRLHDLRKQVFIYWKTPQNHFFRRISELHLDLPQTILNSDPFIVYNNVPILINWSYKFSITNWTFYFVSMNLNTAVARSISTKHSNWFIFKIKAYITNNACMFIIIFIIWTLKFRFVINKT